MNPLAGLWDGHPVLDEEALAHLPEDYKDRIRKRLEEAGPIATYTFSEDGSARLQVRRSEPVDATYALDGSRFTVTFTVTGERERTVTGELEDGGAAFLVRDPPAMHRFVKRPD